MAKMYEGIDGYSEMTPEQKLAYWENLEQSANEAKLKNLLSERNSEVAKLNKALKEKMSEDERKAAEALERQTAMEKELETLRREKRVSDFKAAYIANGYSEELAAKTAEALADGDTNTVLANNKVFREQLEKELRAQIVSETPKPDGAGGQKPTTKEEIMKIKDPVERQKAISENLSLFGY